jgi:aspartate racemase
MKTIGILGGMSPESTVEYYQIITRSYLEAYGDHGYPPVVIYSVSFQPYIDWPKAGEWDKVGEGLGSAARRLQDAGADFIVIATNTMHKVIDAIQGAVDVPVLSLLDVVADAVEAAGMTAVGLLGTIFTMEETFYQDALGARGITALTPEKADREIVNRVIYDELTAGIIREESRAEYVRIIQALQSQGAQGVILGCTEIPLLVGPDDVSLPLFDTTRLHAEAALAEALGRAG